MQVSHFLFTFSFSCVHNCIYSLLFSRWEALKAGNVPDHELALSDKVREFMATFKPRPPKMNLRMAYKGGKTDSFTLSWTAPVDKSETLVYLGKLYSLLKLLMSSRLSRLAKVNPFLLFQMLPHYIHL